MNDNEKAREIMLGAVFMFFFQCGDCRGCYFGKPPEEGQFYPSWDCKFNSDNPGDWEV